MNFEGRIDHAARQVVELGIRLLSWRLGVLAIHSLPSARAGSWLRLDDEIGDYPQ